MSGSNRDYRLQVGDEIQLKFYLSPELDQDAIVRPDGRISLQLLDDVAAVGLTPKQLEKIVTDGYRTELRNPEITVIVKKMAAKVYVGGEVRQPRFVAHSGSLTSLQDAFVDRGVTAKPEASRVL